MPDYNDSNKTNNHNNNNNNSSSSSNEATSNSTTNNNNNNSNNNNEASTDMSGEKWESETTEPTLLVTPAPPLSAPTTPTTPTKPLKSILRLNTHLTVPAAPAPTPLVRAAAPPNAKAKSGKKQRIDKNDLGDDFVAPDGGWGWVVAIASGVNILVSYALAQQFGIVFRDHMRNLGVSSSKLTTIINIQVAVSAFTGLLNGPLFRNFTYRQVAVVGSVLTFLGLFLLVFAGSFAAFIFAFSILYAIGRGVASSASSLAVNTYFKLKRRNATAYQFTVAGLGPIFYPYLATYLMEFYGVRGTVLVFAGLALHSVACSLIYQPVMWHVKPLPFDSEKSAPSPDIEEEIIDSICEPDTPILPRANDGWFGSRSSLSPTVRRRTSISGEYYGTELRRLSGKSPNFSKSPSIREELDDDDNDDEFDYATRKPTRLPEGVPFQIPKEKVDLNALEDEEREKLPFYMKVVIFFDLDLLRDVTYMNLACGLMLINFVEINFAILTPFILSDFGFQSHQIAFAMSMLGLCDLVLRFAIPLITTKMTKVSNKTFFAAGILGMCIGRFILAFTRNFYVLVAVFVFLGLNKAFRTVFWTLIIPSYVPLKRLPAASGLQLLMSGTFSMVFGPIIGLIKDKTNYVVTLIVLNLICVLALLLWLVEALVRKARKKKRSETALNDIKS